MSTPSNSTSKPAVGGSSGTPLPSRAVHRKRSLNDIFFSSDAETSSNMDVSTPRLSHMSSHLVSPSGTNNPPSTGGSTRMSLASPYRSHHTRTHSTVLSSQSTLRTSILEGLPPGVINILQQHNNHHNNHQSSNLHSPQYNPKHVFRIPQLLPGQHHVCKSGSLKKKANGFLGVFSRKYFTLSTIDGTISYTDKQDGTFPSYYFPLVDIIRVYPKRDNLLNIVFHNRYDHSNASHAQNVTLDAEDDVPPMNSPSLSLASAKDDHNDATVQTATLLKRFQQREQMYPTQNLSNDLHPLPHPTDMLVSKVANSTTGGAHGPIVMPYGGKPSQYSASDDAPTGSLEERSNHHFPNPNVTATSSALGLNTATAAAAGSSAKRTIKETKEQKQARQLKDRKEQQLRAMERTKAKNASDSNASSSNITTANSSGATGSNAGAGSSDDIAELHILRLQCANTKERDEWLIALHRAMLYIKFRQYTRISPFGRFNFMLHSYHYSINFAQKLVPTLVYLLKLQAQRAENLAQQQQQQLCGATATTASPPSTIASPAAEATFSPSSALSMQSPTNQSLPHTAALVSGPHDGPTGPGEPALSAQSSISELHSPPANMADALSVALSSSQMFPQSSIHFPQGALAASLQQQRPAGGADHSKSTAANHHQLTKHQWLTDTSMSRNTMQSHLRFVPHVNEHTLFGYNCCNCVDHRPGGPSCDPLTCPLPRMYKYYTDKPRVSAQAFANCPTRLMPGVPRVSPDTRLHGIRQSLAQLVQLLIFAHNAPQHNAAHSLDALMQMTEVPTVVKQLFDMLSFITISTDTELLLFLLHLVDVRLKLLHSHVFVPDDSSIVYTIHRLPNACPPPASRSTAPAGFSLKHTVAQTPNFVGGSFFAQLRSATATSTTHMPQATQPLPQGNAMTPANASSGTFFSAASKSPQQQQQQQAHSNGDNCNNEASDNNNLSNDVGTGTMLLTAARNPSPASGQALISHFDGSGYPLTGVSDADHDQHAPLPDESSNSSSQPQPPLRQQTPSAVSSQRVSPMLGPSMQRFSAPSQQDQTPSAFPLPTLARSNSQQLPTMEYIPRRAIFQALDAALEPDTTTSLQLAFSQDESSNPPVTASAASFDNMPMTLRRPTLVQMNSTFNNNTSAIKELVLPIRKTVVTGTASAPSSPVHGYRSGSAFNDIQPLAPLQNIASTATVEPAAFSAVGSSPLPPSALASAAIATGQHASSIVTPFMLTELAIPCAVVLVLTNFLCDLTLQEQLGAALSNIGNAIHVDAMVQLTDSANADSVAAAAATAALGTVPSANVADPTAASTETKQSALTDIDFILPKSRVRAASRAPAFQSQSSVGASPVISSLNKVADGGNALTATASAPATVASSTTQLQQHQSALTAVPKPAQLPLPRQLVHLAENIHISSKHSNLLVHAPHLQVDRDQNGARSEYATMLHSIVLELGLTFIWQIQTLRFTLYEYRSNIMPRPDPASTSHNELFYDIFDAQHRSLGLDHHQQSGSIAATVHMKLPGYRQASGGMAFVAGTATAPLSSDLNGAEETKAASLQHRYRSDPLVGRLSASDIDLLAGHALLDFVSKHVIVNKFDTNPLSIGLRNRVLSLVFMLLSTPGSLIQQQTALVHFEDFKQWQQSQHLDTAAGHPFSPSAAITTTPTATTTTILQNALTQPQGLVSSPDTNHDTSSANTVMEHQPASRPPVNTVATSPIGHFTSSSSIVPETPQLQTIASYQTDGGLPSGSTSNVALPNPIYNAIIPVCYPGVPSAAAVAAADGAATPFDIPLASAPILPTSFRPAPFLQKLLTTQALQVGIHVRYESPEISALQPLGQDELEQHPLYLRWGTTAQHFGAGDALMGLHHDEVVTPSTSFRDSRGSHMHSQSMRPTSFLKVSLNYSLLDPHRQQHQPGAVSVVPAQPPIATSPQSPLYSWAIAKRPELSSADRVVFHSGVWPCVMYLIQDSDHLTRLVALSDVQLLITQSLHNLYSFQHILGISNASGGASTATHPAFAKAAAQNAQERTTQKAAKRGGVEALHAFTTAMDQIQSIDINMKTLQECIDCLNQQNTTITQFNSLLNGCIQTTIQEVVAYEALMNAANVHVFTRQLCLFLDNREFVPRALVHQLMDYSQPLVTPSPDHFSKQRIASPASSNTHQIDHSIAPARLTTPKLPSPNSNGASPGQLPLGAITALAAKISSPSSPAPAAGDAPATASSLMLQSSLGAVSPSLGVSLRPSDKPLHPHMGDMVLKSICHLYNHCLAFEHKKYLESESFRENFMVPMPAPPQNQGPAAGQVYLRARWRARAERAQLLPYASSLLHTFSMLMLNFSSLSIVEELVIEYIHHSIARESSFDIQLAAAQAKHNNGRNERAPSRHHFLSPIDDEPLSPHAAFVQNYEQMQHTILKQRPIPPSFLDLDLPHPPARRGRSGDSLPDESLSITPYIPAPAPVPTAPSSSLLRFVPANDRNAVCHDGLPISRLFPHPCLAQPVAKLHLKQGLSSLLSPSLCLDGLPVPGRFVTVCDVLSSQCTLYLWYKTRIIEQRTLQALEVAETQRSQTLSRILKQLQSQKYMYMHTGETVLPHALSRMNKRKANQAGGDSGSLIRGDSFTQMSALSVAAAAAVANGGIEPPSPSHVSTEGNSLEFWGGGMSTTNPSGLFFDDVSTPTQHTGQNSPLSASTSNVLMGATTAEEFLQTTPENVHIIGQIVPTLDLFDLTYTSNQGLTVLSFSLITVYDVSTSGANDSLLSSPYTSRAEHDVMSIFFQAQRIGVNTIAEQQHAKLSLSTTTPSSGGVLGSHRRILFSSWQEWLFSLLADIEIYHNYEIVTQHEPNVFVYRPEPKAQLLHLIITAVQQLFITSLKFLFSQQTVLRYVQQAQVIQHHFFSIQQQQSGISSEPTPLNMTRAGDPPQHDRASFRRSMGNVFFNGDFVRSSQTWFNNSRYTHHLLFAHHNLLMYVIPFNMSVVESLRCALQYDSFIVQQHAFWTRLYSTSSSTAPAAAAAAVQSNSDMLLIGQSNTATQGANDAFGASHGATSGSLQSRVNGSASSRFYQFNYAHPNVFENHMFQAKADKGSTEHDATAAAAAGKDAQHHGNVGTNVGAAAAASASTTAVPVLKEKKEKGRLKSFFSRHKEAKEDKPAVTETALVQSTAATAAGDGGDDDEDDPAERNLFNNQDLPDVTLTLLDPNQLDLASSPSLILILRLTMIASQSMMGPVLHNFDISRNELSHILNDGPSSAAIDSDTTPQHHLHTPQRQHNINAKSLLQLPLRQHHFIDMLQNAFFVTALTKAYIISPSMFCAMVIKVHTDTRELCEQYSRFQTQMIRYRVDYFLSYLNQIRNEYLVVHDLVTMVVTGDLQNSIQAHRQQFLSQQTELAALHSSPNPPTTHDSPQNKHRLVQVLPTTPMGPIAAPQLKHHGGGDRHAQMDDAAFSRISVRLSSLNSTPSIAGSARPTMSMQRSSFGRDTFGDMAAAAAATATAAAAAAAQQSDIEVILNPNKVLELISYGPMLSSFNPSSLAITIQEWAIQNTALCASSDIDNFLVNRPGTTAQSRSPPSTLGNVPSPAITQPSSATAPTSSSPAPVISTAPATVQFASARQEKQSAPLSMADFMFNERHSPNSGLGELPIASPRGRQASFSMSPSFLEDDDQQLQQPHHHGGHLPGFAEDEPVGPPSISIPSEYPPSAPETPSISSGLPEDSTLWQSYTPQTRPMEPPAAVANSFAQPKQSHLASIVVQPGAHKHHSPHLIVPPSSTQHPNNAGLDAGAAGSFNPLGIGGLVPYSNKPMSLRSMCYFLPAETVSLQRVQFTVNECVPPLLETMHQHAIALLGFIDFVIHLPRRVVMSPDRSTDNPPSHAPVDSDSESYEDVPPAATTGTLPGPRHSPGIGGGARPRDSFRHSALTALASLNNPSSILQQQFGNNSIQYINMTSIGAGAFHPGLFSALLAQQENNYWGLLRMYRPMILHEVSFLSDMTSFFSIVLTARSKLANTQRNLITSTYDINSVYLLLPVYRKAIDSENTLRLHHDVDPSLFSSTDIASSGAPVVSSALLPSTQSSSTAVAAAAAAASGPSSQPARGGRRSSLADCFIPGTDNNSLIHQRAVLHMLSLNLLLDFLLTQRRHARHKLFVSYHEKSNEFRLAQQKRESERSSQLDQRLARERLNMLQNRRVLVIGGEKSGKNTFIKQNMRLYTPGFHLIHQECVDNLMFLRIILIFKMIIKHSDNKSLGKVPLSALSNPCGAHSIFMSYDHTLVNPFGSLLFTGPTAPHGYPVNVFQTTNNHGPVVRTEASADDYFSMSTLEARQLIVSFKLDAYVNQRQYIYNEQCHAQNHPRIEMILQTLEDLRVTVLIACAVLWTDPVAKLIFDNVQKLPAMVLPGLVHPDSGKLINLTFEDGDYFLLSRLHSLVVSPSFVGNVTNNDIVCLHSLSCFQALYLFSRQHFVSYPRVNNTSYDEIVASIFHEMEIAAKSAAASAAAAHSHMPQFALLDDEPASPVSDKRTLASGNTSSTTITTLSVVVPGTAVEPVDRKLPGHRITSVAQLISFIQRIQERRDQFLGRFYRIGHTMRPQDAHLSLLLQSASSADSLSAIAGATSSSRLLADAIVQTYTFQIDTIQNDMKDVSTVLYGQKPGVMEIDLPSDQANAWKTEMNQQVNIEQYDADRLAHLEPTTSASTNNKASSRDRKGSFFRSVRERTSSITRAGDGAGANGLALTDQSQDNSNNHRNSFSANGRHQRTRSFTGFGRNPDGTSNTAGDETGGPRNAILAPSKPTKQQLFYRELTHFVQNDLLAHDFIAERNISYSFLNSSSSLFSRCIRKQTSNILSGGLFQNDTFRSRNKLLGHDAPAALTSTTASGQPGGAPSVRGAPVGTVAALSTLFGPTSTRGRMGSSAVVPSAAGPSGATGGSSNLAAAPSASSPLSNNATSDASAGASAASSGNVGPAPTKHSDLKQISQIESHDVIMHIIPLSSYCEIDANKNNRLLKSLRELDLILSSPLLADKPVVVVLNKLDLFVHKLRSTGLSQCFQRYQEPLGLSSAYSSAVPSIPAVPLATATTRRMMSTISAVHSSLGSMGNTNAFITGPRNSALPTRKQNPATDGRSSHLHQHGSMQDGTAATTSAVAPSAVPLEAVIKTPFVPPITSQEQAKNVDNAVNFISRELMKVVQGAASQNKQPQHSLNSLNATASSSSGGLFSSGGLAAVNSTSSQQLEFRHVDVGRLVTDWYFQNNVPCVQDYVQRTVQLIRSNPTPSNAKTPTAAAPPARSAQSKVTALQRRKYFNAYGDMEFVTQLDDAQQHQLQYSQSHQQDFITAQQSHLRLDFESHLNNVFLTTTPTSNFGYGTLPRADNASPLNDVGGAPVPSRSSLLPSVASSLTGGNPGGALAPTGGNNGITNSLSSLGPLNSASQGQVGSQQQQQHNSLVGRPVVFVFTSLIDPYAVEELSILNFLVTTDQLAHYTSPLVDPVPVMGSNGPAASSLLPSTQTGGPFDHPRSFARINSLAGGGPGSLGSSNMANTLTKQGTAFLGVPPSRTATAGASNYGSVSNLHAMNIPLSTDQLPPSSPRRGGNGPFFRPTAAAPATSSSIPAPAPASYGSGSGQSITSISRPGVGATPPTSSAVPPQQQFAQYDDSASDRVSLSLEHNNTTAAMNSGNPHATPVMRFAGAADPLVTPPFGPAANASSPFASSPMSALPIQSYSAGSFPMNPRQRGNSALTQSPVPRRTALDLLAEGSFSSSSSTSTRFQLAPHPQYNIGGPGANGPRQ